MKYCQWVTAWLENEVRPARKSRTYEKYESIARKWLLPRFGDREIGALTRAELQGFSRSLSASGLAPSTVCGAITVLRQSLMAAEDRGVIPHSPAAALRFPRRRESEIRCFTREEQRAIESFCMHREKPAYLGVVLCLYTGLRIGELMALQWEDIDLSAGALFVRHSCRDSWETGEYRKVLEAPKTPRSFRTIPLPRQLMPVLRRARQAATDPFVVPGHLRVRSYQKSFSTLLAKCGIPHRGFHALRHTFATRALECGMDVRTLAEILGHENVSVTLNRYAHSLSEHKCAMMNRIGAMWNEKKFAE